MSRGARKTVEYTDAPGETWLLKQEDAVVARCPLRLPIFSATSPYRETTVLREPVGENAPASRLDAPARLLRVDKNARQRFSVVPNLRNTTAMNLGLPSDMKDAICFIWLLM